MRRVLIALLLIAGAEAAALACSCVPPPRSAQEASAAAREVARHAVAMVEVQVDSGYDTLRQRGELVSVRRVLAGRAPRAFRVFRTGEPNSAACAVGLARGERRLLILYPARRGAAGEMQFAIQSLCTDYFMHDQRFRDLLLAELRRRR